MLARSGPEYDHFSSSSHVSAFGIALVQASSPTWKDTLGASSGKSRGRGAKVTCFGDLSWFFLPFVFCFVGSSCCSTRCCLGTSRVGGDCGFARDWGGEILGGDEFLLFLISAGGVCSMRAFASWKDFSPSKQMKDNISCIRDLMRSKCWAFSGRLSASASSPNMASTTSALSLRSTGFCGPGRRSARWSLS